MQKHTHKLNSKNWRKQEISIEERLQSKEITKPISKCK
jgi:hypothetical protein